jgi:hypothetical protein
MKDDKGAKIIDMSKARKKRLAPKPLKKPIEIESLEINEMGEITLKKQPPQSAKLSWQYRFFMFMFVFLLITLVLSSLFQDTN